MTEIGYFTPDTPGFRNRSTLLLVIGIFFIIGGALAGCGGLMAPVALFIPQPANMPKQTIGTIIIAMVMYAAASGLLITLGIGAIRKRRWVRPIVLSLAWIGLVMGCIALFAWLTNIGSLSTMMQTQMARASAGRPAPPPAMIKVIVVGMTLFMVTFYLVIPVLLIWLFRSADVSATLEFYDPQPRWTDARPLPVLILFMMLVLSTLWALAALMQGWFPLFGRVLYGAPAIIGMLTLAAFNAVGAGLVLRRRRSGWWMALFLWSLGSISWIVTLLRADLLEIYRRSGMDERQIDMMRETTMVTGGRLAAYAAAMAVIALVFLVKSRRYFNETSLTAAL